MRCILLLTIVLLAACENKEETIVNRQQAIQKEMEDVKAAYFKTTDSLGAIKDADTSSTKQHEIAEELQSVGGQKNVVLTTLQREFDSLEAELKK